MRCPHCTVSFHDNEVSKLIGRDPDGHWGYGVCRCSACGKLVIRLFSSKDYFEPIEAFGAESSSQLVRPKVAGRPPIPPEVPSEYVEDYRESCLVLCDSPKASAALSRRCLQHILRGALSTKRKDLSDQIQEVLDRGTLPSHIADSLDAVRNIGNFAAHPNKSISTGEILAVETGEAEWNLDVLEDLFDFCFVAPARTAAKKAALNSKLKDAGKPPMKR